MSKKVKIFMANKNPNLVEAEVNQWLEENRDIEIIKLFPAEFTNSETGPSSALIVFYEAAIENVKRQHERIDLIEILDYSVDEQYYRDFFQDISESGLLIRTSNSFPMGKEILMTLMSSEQERPIKIKGEVVRLLPDGIGVKFKIESQVQSDMISSIVKNLQSSE